MTELKWRKVLCPIDFSEESRAALRVAVDLAHRFEADLVLLHADLPESVFKGAAAPEGQLAEWKTQAEAMGAKRVQTVHVREPPGKSIVEGASRGGADLIVMGTHGRTGRHHALLGSTAEEVVRQSRIPVLTVHADWP
jgi:nucleotide-binding universal stress UspA family protein